MNRLLLTFAVVSSWSSLLLIDSTIKGGVILLLAACVALIAVSSATSDSSVNGDDVADQSLIAVFEDAVRQLQIRQHVCLMMHPDRSIPIVWGLWRFRLLLPDAARDWSIEQQKSVVLHELAHIKRRDTLTQLLSQFACAIYWFNPLVWFAAWRLHVERERACDDLVLCNGVPASAYAEHLLDVASRLTSSPWTQACGLAMARRSSLEGRLTAVLSQQRNRHAVAGVIVVASLLLGVAVAVPVAMLRASENIVQTDEGDPHDEQVAEEMTGDDDPRKQENADDETPNLLKHIVARDPAKGEKVDRGKSLAGNPAAAPPPASETPKQYGPKDWAGWFLNQVQFRKHQDGTFPPAAFKHLRAQVVAALKADPAAEGATTARAWLETTAAQRNWNEAEFKLQVEEIAAWELSAVQQAMNKEEFAEKCHPKQGETMAPEALEKLSFGPAAENGLRVAWAFVPSKKEYSVGESLRSRVIVHNSGDQPVQFLGQNTQDGKWSIHDASGNAIKVRPLPYSNVWLHPELFPYQRYRLQPNQVVELGGQGVGIGEGDHSASKTQIVIWRVIKAHSGDAVRIGVESEFGLPEGQRYVFKSQDEFPEEQSRDWSGTLHSGEVSFQVVAAKAHDPIKPGEKISGELEQKLKWGKTVNGLRAALAIRNSPDDVETPDLFLAVQNVSRTPIHLKDIVAARGQRLLTLFREDLAQSQTRIDQPTMANVLLRPREVAFLEMAPKVVPGSEKRSKGQSLANVLLKIPEEMLVGEMTVTTAPAGGWTGKLVTGKTDGAAAKGDPMPKSKTAQALFEQWTANARLNGKIPGGQIRSLAKVTSNFVGYNPTDERAPALAKLLKRMDASRDWTRQEVVDLLNDVTDIYDELPSWVADTRRFSLSDVITTGKPLPEDLKNAPWGEAHPSGLRAAWLLDPQAKGYRLNTPLKSRILYHNDGAETVVFRVVSWNQSGSHQAHDATGRQIQTRSTDWTTIGQMKAVRLAPGEFTEVIGAGIGIGPNNDAEDWRNTRVGTWIHAKAGEEITFTPDAITASGDDGRRKEFEDSVWWRSLITKRLERDAPTPDDDKERQRILDRAVRDLFGTPSTPAEINAFIADRGPDAMKSLAERLAKRAGTKSVFGQLKSGPTKFRVLPIDPDAKNKPYLAVGPGRYQFDNNATLVIVGRGRVMDAKLEFNGDDASAKSYPIKLPDGRGTWAIAWKRNMTTFWIAEKGSLRSVDFSNPKQILEVRVGPDDKLPITKYFMDALRPTYQPD